MGKILSIRQVAALKRTAQNNYPLIQKREKLIAAINELSDELEIVNAQIDGSETGSRAISGGFNSTELVERLVIPTGKVDVNGKEVKVTKYVARQGALKQNEDGTYEVLLEAPKVEPCEEEQPPIPTEEPVSEQPQV